MEQNQGHPQGPASVLLSKGTLETKKKIYNAVLLGIFLLVWGGVMGFE